MSHRAWRTVLAVLAGYLGLAGGCPIGAAVAVEGRDVYNFRCYYCHGYSGNGRTLAATFLSPPPTDFTRAAPDRLTEGAIVETLRHGRPGTAMKPFASVITEAELVAVARFVRDEFVVRRAENTRYHTEANGWPDHDRYRIAFPFATGEISLSRPWESLSTIEAEGRRLYLGSCVSCHDRGAPTEDDVAWDARPLSYPRNNFSLADPPKVDAMTSASPYAKHDRVPVIAGLGRQERRGQRLFQANCAFCHGADGMGRNWIGRFLEPHPRDLRDSSFMSGMTRERLAGAIADGLPNTSMPAWKAVLSKDEIRAVVDYVARAFHPLPAWRAGQPLDSSRTAQVIR
jgi:cytochrome c oxidase cbb3-type subunit 3